MIPNAGSWITTRDRTDYSIPDGVMIEGFAEAGPTSFYAHPDWRLQMNRILGRPLLPFGGGALDAAADTHGWGLGETPVRGKVPVPAHGAVVVLG